MADREAEHGAALRMVRRADVTAVHLCDAARNGKPKSGSVRPRGEEGIENPILAPGRQTAEVDGLRRCVDATGQAVFTDRRCDSMDAIDSLPVLPRIRPPASAIPIRGCARTRRDLLDGVRTALEMRDPNRFSGYYDWSGMDGTQGYRLLDRLEALTKRPFIDARLVSSRAPPVNDDEGGFGLLSRPFLGALSPEAAPRPPPADLLRIDQMRSATDGASQVTYFRLRANAGCWWLAY